MELKKPREHIQEIKLGITSIDDYLAPPGKYASQVTLEKLQVEVLPSGFASLDAYKWLKKGIGELIVVGGRPSQGKSSLMHQASFYISRTAATLNFSLEMPEDQVIAREVSQYLGRSLDSVQRGKVPASEMERAKQHLSNCKFIVYDLAGVNVIKIADIARQWAKREELALITVDYLQIIRPERSQSRDVEVGQLTFELKALAKELKCPVMVGAQLNRQCEMRGQATGNYKPRLSDLRESGSIEADADVIAFVSREYVYTGQRPDEADIIIGKNRNGACGEVILGWDGTQTRFFDKDEI